MDNHKYPDWQATIRKAQALEEERIEVINAEADREAQEKQRQSGAKLGRALDLLGVKLAAVPTSNPHIHDGFVFRLKDWDSSTWNYSDSAPRFNTRGSQADEEIQFALYVSKETPAGVEVEDWDVRGAEVVVRWRRVDSDWQREQARLAYALDEAQSAYDSWLEVRRLNQQHTAEEKASNQPTLEEEFFALFKRLVRKCQTYEDDDLAVFSTDDFGY